ncbi:MAG: PEP-CTERM sorting domain-containing protein [Acidobacteria bacterium]|nr:PEP-CTERM sorting domain-containing protein [Acidobacteriota bacterium]
MDFVQRAKALIKSSAKSGALKILPLAAAAALSMGSGQAAATFETGSAFPFCPNGSLALSNTPDTGGVVGLKIANSSGGQCVDAGFGSAFISVGASGGGSGTFDAALTQLAVTFDFTGFATENGLATEFVWDLLVQLNTSAGSVSGGNSGGAPNGSVISSADVGAILIDMTSVQGADFQSWSVLLSLSASAIEGEPTMVVAVQIPNNSIDINGVQTTVDPVPEPGTLALMFVGGVAYLVRRRMAS